MHDLLCDRILPIHQEDAAGATLPEVLAALSAGRHIVFPGLAAYQRQSWFCFLVQLSALAMSAAGRPTPPGDAAGWHELLAALAGTDADTAFALVVEDVSRPALLQPPVRNAAAWAKYRGPIAYPDSIDLLITAKNHDLKLERMGRPAPHHWLYALVNLQTMQGFLGRGNYGIARMNGGFSSRAFADRMAGPGWAPRFRRALHMLLAQRNNLLRDYADYFQSSGGLGLVWLEPWDDNQVIGLDRLDPYFIEICRRLRLIVSHGAVGAMVRPSEGPRLNGAAAKGVLGDPWAPVDSAAGTAVTVGAGGFDYRRIVDLLTDRGGLPRSLRAEAGDPDQALDLQFSVLVRGQGRTDGLHERVVPISRSLADRLADEGMSLRLRHLSQTMLNDVGKGAAQALRTGLRAYLQGGPDKIAFDDDRVRPFAEAFDQDVDGAFLCNLFRRAEAAGDGAAETEAWFDWLRRRATHHFERGLAQLPVPSQRRERARAAAERSFHGRLRNALPRAAGAASEDPS